LEVLRRRGIPAKLPVLATEMGTTERGTSLAAVATGLIKHGVAAQGVSLTMTGLAEQKFPVVAVVAPGHFVIVNSVSSKAISLWSPDSDGTGHGQTVAVTPIQWQQVWRGTALALNGIVGAGSAHTENTRNSASNGI
jgi:ABC-type bacteriocin/lantibiotic exporter with double-glycine peptidase domain